MLTLDTLKTGDLIVRKKGRFSAHYLVFLFMQNGEHIVAENQNGHGVRYNTLSRALRGKPIKRFERFGGTEAQRKQVIPRIERMLGQAYDLVVFNCEHFARWVAHGRIESRQVRKTSNLALAVGTGLAVYALSKRSAVAGLFGVAAILIGGAGRASQRRR
jgi:hypothetical protein